jgi:hypothetical protein
MATEGKKQHFHRVDTSNVPLTGATAERLADLVGVERDLRWAARACGELSSVNCRYNNDQLALEGIHDSALIRYGRCFKEGRRNAFQIPKSWIGELTPELREAHSEAIRIRDKHIAHSVNDWELNTPCAQIVRVKEYGTASVRRVHVSHQRVFTLSPNGLRTLSRLATALADRVAEVGRYTQEKLFAEIRGVPPHELERRAPPFRRAGQRGAATSRRR